MGKKRHPLYRIIVTDVRKTRDGQYIEKLGQYSPKATEMENKVVLNGEKAKLWLKRGAQPTQQVKNIFSDLKILESIEAEAPLSKKKSNKRKNRLNPIAKRVKKEKSQLQKSKKQAKPKNKEELKKEESKATKEVKAKPEKAEPEKVKQEKVEQEKVEQENPETAVEVQASQKENESKKEDQAAVLDKQDENTKK